MTKTLEERFWEKVIKTDSCWLWIAATTKGYGRFRIGTLKEAHRVSYELVKGSIPEGLVLDHLCRVKNCVNPEHLEPVTNAENINRGDKTNQGWNNRSKTHCPKGHAYAGENLNFYKGRRVCRTCNRIKSKEFYWERRKNEVK
jgi:hypothetical protein